MHTLSLIAHSILAWCAAHPTEALLALGAVLSLINGALPARVQRGPVGRVLHAVLDRVTVLSRSDARGTLKLPFVASELLEAGVRAAPVPEAPEAPRHTLAPPEPSQRGSVELGAMGYLLALIVVGVHVVSCVPIRRFVLDHTDGVPARGPCVVGAQRCDGLVPVVCSADHREWPSLPRRADGAQRTCAPGVCVVDGDGGVAHCALSDGGAE